MLERIALPLERIGVPRRALLAGFPAILRARPRLPNVLLMLGDNWAAPHASALGDPVVKTPVFDRIANEGVLFTSACSPNPSCSPARSSLLTGQETHRLGEAANLYGPLAPKHPRYPDALERAGYVCGYAGKAWGPGQPPADACRSSGERRSIEELNGASEVSGIASGHTRQEGRCPVDGARAVSNLRGGR